MVNILVDMTSSILRDRLICLGVIATLFFGVVSPAWAQEENENESEAGESGYKDPTIVTDDSTSVPDGVKDLGKKEKKPIEDPIYNKWWFWAAAVAVAGAVVTAAVIPLQKKAPTCAQSTYPLGCTGDGR